MRKEFIFVVGGCVSGLGKGVVASSIGNILINKGYMVNLTKFDPYLNYSAKNLAPCEHGEVFVTRDGSEVDLDIGHYQRFTGLSLGGENCYTSGRIIGDLIEKERRGELNGETLQYVPTVTDKITQLYRESLEGVDISIIEIGGTVGDVESYPYFHAISNLEDVKITIFQLVLILENNGEEKTKPAQNAIKELRAFGLNPDYIICRSSNTLTDKTLNKISKITRIKSNNILSLENVNDIYCVPERIKSLLYEYCLGNNDKVFPLLVFNSLEKINIDICGKYTKDTDAYLSICESLKHSANRLNRTANIRIVFDGNLNKDVDAVIIPGGFGTRGISTKLNYISECIEKNIPTLGICLGMQLMFLELLWRYSKIKGMSEEGFYRFDEEGLEVISRVTPDISLILGQYKCSNGRYNIFRHRYACDSNLLESLSNVNIIHYNDVLGYPTGLELLGHKFFRGVQYHPEFESNQNNPQEDFTELLEGVLN